MKILLVEDDLDLLDVTAYALRRECFAVIEATDGAQAMQRWKTDQPDLIILDLGLPREDGFAVLTKLRAKSTTPVIVLSGRLAEDDVVRAFGLGADDYVVKPFAVKQLASRIRAIMRRTSLEPIVQAPPTIQLGDLRVEPETQEVTWRGMEIRLTPTEFRIFNLLALHPDRIVTTGRLLAYVWGESGGDPNALRTHISHIRTKLGLGRRINGSIVGIPGVGYRFKVALMESHAGTSDALPRATGTRSLAL